MNIASNCLFIVLSSSTLISYSQISDSSLKTSSRLLEKYYSKVDKKVSLISDRLSNRSIKYLAKFQRQEKKFEEKIEKLVPGNAGNVIVDAGEGYKELSSKIKSEIANGTTKINSAYNPYIDSLRTSLSFLKQFNCGGDKGKEPLTRLNILENKLLQSDKIKEFIAHRKDRIKQLLSGYAKIPEGLKNKYDKLNKTAYYYTAQVNEYKDILKDPKKAERKGLSILCKLPAFQKFMKQSGQLASLFRINENTDPVQSLAGLQTRSSVLSIIQQKVVSDGPNGAQVIQQNIAQAKNELNKIKDKINLYGGGSSEAEIPDFKVNNEKVKSVLKRLEYSVNIQFAKTNKFLPSSADVGLGIAYKLNEKSIIGIGMSYKMGIGSIRHVSFSNQGLGLRTLLDWKIKKQFFATAGYEMNYNAAFKKIEQLKNYNAWQRSTLMGISKKYKINKKVKGEMKLLYDFLANTHIPVTQAFLVRFGYNF